MASTMSSNGQGGFGVSEFFTRPSYQNGLTGSAMRSVPDVVVDADPSKAFCFARLTPEVARAGSLCGTSMAAPEWRHI